MSKKISARIAMQVRIDGEILFYVRESQQCAPVTAEAVHGFLKRTRGFDVDLFVVADRLAYLVSKKNLSKERVWEGGEWEDYFEVTAKGMDVLDGVLPPNA